MQRSLKDSFAGFFVFYEYKIFRYKFEKDYNDLSERTKEKFREQYKLICKDPDVKSLKNIISVLERAIKYSQEIPYRGEK